MIKFTACTLILNYGNQEFRVRQGRSLMFSTDCLCRILQLDPRLVFGRQRYPKYIGYSSVTALLDQAVQSSAGAKAFQHWFLGDMEEQLFIACHEIDERRKWEDFAAREYAGLIAKLRTGIAPLDHPGSPGY